MSIGFYTVSVIIIGLMMFAIMILGGIYYHIKMNTPWDGVDRRNNCCEHNDETE
jgi:hypothetical protein